MPDRQRLDIILIMIDIYIFFRICSSHSEGIFIHIEKSSVGYYLHLDVLCVLIARLRPTAGYVRPRTAGTMAVKELRRLKDAVCIGL